MTTQTRFVTGIRDLKNGLFNHGYVGIVSASARVEIHGGPAREDGTLDPNGFRFRDFVWAAFEQRQLAVGAETFRNPMDFFPSGGLGGTTVYEQTLAIVPDAVGLNITRGLARDLQSFRSGLNYEVGLFSPDNSNLIYGYVTTYVAVAAGIAGYSPSVVNFWGDDNRLLPGLDFDQIIDGLPANMRVAAGNWLSQNERYVDAINAVTSYEAAYGDRSTWTAGDYLNVRIATFVGAEFQADGSWSFDNFSDWIDAMEYQFTGNAPDSGGNDPFDPGGVAPPTDPSTPGFEGYVDPVDGTVISPLVIDLDGDGVELMTGQNGVTFDWDGDGFRERMGWVHEDDAFLVIDLAANGGAGADNVIDQAREIAFANWTATPNDTDLQALRTVFDSNRDGVFNAQDARWNEFRIWQDKDSDGEVDLADGELRFMNGVDVRHTSGSPDPVPFSIQAVNLSYSNGAAFGDTSDDVEFGNIRIHGQTTVIGQVFGPSGAVIGSNMLAADVSLDVSDLGARFETTTTGYRLVMETGEVTTTALAEGRASPNLNLGSLSVNNGYGDSRANVIDARGLSTGARIAGLGGNDTLYGGSGDDLINGGDGVDWIDAGAGDDQIYFTAGDTVQGGAGFDTGYVMSNDAVVLNLSTAGLEAIVGGGGNDRFFVTASSTQQVDMSGGAGNDTLEGGAGSDKLSGGEGNDRLVGRAGDDVLVGEAGNDTLIGEAGNDVLMGGDGADLMIGGVGRDLLIGGAGVDRAVYTTAGTAIRADLLNPSTNTGDAAGDIYEEMEDLQGGAHSDLLLGDHGNNRIWGGNGNDRIWGRNGQDRLVGQNGNDTLYGEAGNDQLHGEAGDDWLYGGSGNDWLYGREGNDRLFGEAGNDLIDAGAGNDTMDGGSGADRFHIREGYGSDVIQNFEYGTDSIIFIGSTLPRSYADFIDVTPVAAILPPYQNPYMIPVPYAAISGATFTFASGSGTGTLTVLAPQGSEMVWTNIRDIEAGVEHLFATNNVFDFA